MPTEKGPHEHDDRDGEQPDIFPTVYRSAEDAADVAERAEDRLDGWRARSDPQPAPTADPA